MTKKEKKCLRDKQAFQDGKAYRWHQRPATRFKHTGTVPTDSYASDNSSLSLASSRSSSRQPKHTRRPKRRRHGEGPAADSFKKRITDHPSLIPSESLGGSS